MHRVFNCGIGMVVVLSPEQVPAAARVLEAEGEQVFTIGTIEKGPGGEADCVVV
jgi:phosphoribosylformylglycinamidine cyclo-ligase